MKEDQINMVVIQEIDMKKIEMVEWGVTEIGEIEWNMKNPIKKEIEEMEEEIII